MSEIPLDELSHGGRPEWRKTLYASFLLKFVSVSGGDGVTDGASVTQTFPRALTAGVQTFEVPEMGGITQTLGSEFCSGSGDVSSQAICRCLRCPHQPIAGLQKQSTPQRSCF